jgi:hypothetical protein
MTAWQIKACCDIVAKLYNLDKTTGVVSESLELVMVISMVHNSCSSSIFE